MSLVSKAKQTYFRVGDENEAAGAGDAAVVAAE